MAGPSLNEMRALRTGLAAGVPFRKGQRVVRAPAGALASGATSCKGRLSASDLKEATSLLALHFQRVNRYPPALLSRLDYSIAATE